MGSYRLFLKLSSHAKIRWKLTGIAYFCTLITVLLNMAQPFLFSYLIDKVLIGKEMNLLIPILAISIGFAVLAVILNILRDCLYRYLDICTTLNLRNKLLAHLRRIPLTEIEKYGPGKFTPLLAGDTATMSNFLNQILVEMTIQFFTMAFAVGMVFYLNWHLGLIVLASIPFILLIPRIFQKKLTEVSSHIRTHNEEIGTHLYECIQGSREIKAFGLERWEDRRNDKLYKNLISISTRETIYRAVTGQTSALAISIIIVMLYGFGSNQISNGSMTIGMLVAAVQYFNNALRPIQMVNNFFADVKRCEVSMTRIEEFLAIPIESNMLDADCEAHETPSDSLPANLECRDLNVSYEGVHILKGVDVTVQSGQVAAFVGTSGSGKTTLFKTLFGFMPHQSGEIQMMGRPSKSWSRSALTHRIGMMFQESFIFRGTLYENIALGNLTATEEEVYDAACRAGLKHYIDSLPDGLQSKIDNQGFQLSGGQRQRVAIARLILKKPAVLILDEPTSALDRVTEDQVLTALHEVMKGKTTLISTHRLENIVSADLIYVLDQGRIADFGTHAELLERCALYRELINEQSHATLQKAALV